MRTTELITLKWKFSGRANKYAKNLRHAWEFWRYNNALDDAIQEVLSEAAPEITAWMKENAPWTDRTTKARYSLKAEMGDFWYRFQDGDERNFKSTTRLVIGYIATADPVWYAWYLETIKAGKWAIVGPALDEWGPIIWNRIKTRIGLK